VTKNIPANCLAVGNPARVVRHLAKPGPITNSSSARHRVHV
jgi:acetyltransferase-like isoleucine patch superfamily enzyme